MPIPAGVTHVVFGGSMPGGETWESGFWVTGAGITSAATANAYAELMWGQLSSSDASGAMYHHMSLEKSTVTFSYVRVYSYTVSGTTATYTGEYLPSTPLVGGNATGNPNQIALVISLRSDFSGRAHRGRMYLTGTGLVTSLAGQALPATCAAEATAWALCFSDINAGGDSGLVVVMSRTGAGGTVPVTYVSVDTILDTQRKRRNKLTPLAVEVGTVTGPT